MEVSQLMPEMPSQQIELSGMRTAFAPQDSMAAKRLELDGPAKIPQPAALSTDTESRRPQTLRACILGARVVDALSSAVNGQKAQVEGGRESARRFRRR